MAIKKIADEEAFELQGFELDVSEKKWWSDAIKSLRDEHIKEPSRYINKVLEEMRIDAKTLEKGVEEALNQLRAESWAAYVGDESRFHKLIVTYLTQERPMPRKILSGLINTELDPEEISGLDKSALFEKLSRVVGDYAGSVMPYIYALCLSTTQSRRSRAGNEFEAILEAFMDILGYPYDTQKKISTNLFKETGLGKKVDLVVPDADAYKRQRSMCAIVTAKTTLRERWQEVAEELSRTGVPHIYLVTLDTSITHNVINTMKPYNITLVVRTSEKRAKFADIDTVKSLDELFFKELPHILSYWKK
jgi:hypothetical protein